jgi:hypothetical protein
MSDEKFEQFLKSAAQSYNAPPARVPREEMWDAIKAERSSGPRVVYGGVSHVRSENRFGVKIWWAAAAALLLVASGIGIGRWTTSSGTNVVTAPPGPGAAPVQKVASDTIRPDGPRPPRSEVALGAPSGTEGPRVEQGSRVSPVDDVGGREPRMVATTPAPGTSASSEGSIPPGRTPPRGASSSAYEMVQVNHLSEAEAMLTSFRTRLPSDQQQDARLAAWARDLLSKTRLLLDSPVAEDPQRRPLLQDLELLLVQIVQLSPGSTPQDREIVERTLEQDNLMTKLRTAIPAGQQGS